MRKPLTAGAWERRSGFLSLVEKIKSMVRRTCLSVVACGCAVLLSCAVRTVDSDKAARPGSDPRDDFQTGHLNTARWQRTQEGDFKEATVDVVDVDPGKGTDYRLRLRADTIGTRDDTVKFLGARSIDTTDFARGVVVSFDLDWNKQANGCYLSAAVYLCPTITSANPRDEADWLKFEYVGVPPGKKARSVVTKRTNGRVQYLDRDGWPDKQRAGRKIGNQRVDLIIDEKSLKVIENGEELFSADDHGLDFTQAYLYLQMSSHSNYPAREIYFDNITISDSCDVPMD